MSAAITLFDVGTVSLMRETLHLFGQVFDKLVFICSHYEVGIDWRF